MFGVAFADLAVNQCAKLACLFSFVSGLWCASVATATTSFDSTPFREH